VFVFVFMCVCVCVCTYIYTHICMHIYTDCLCDNSADASQCWNIGPGGRASKASKDGVGAGKEVGQEPEGPASKKKSVDFVADEYVLAYEDSAVDSEEACLDKYRYSV
jgi:hypothetical protein